MCRYGHEWPTIRGHAVDGDGNPQRLMKLLLHLLLDGSRHGGQIVECEHAARLRLEAGIHHSQQTQECEMLQQSCRLLRGDKELVENLRRYASLFRGYGTTLARASAALMAG